jgi:CO dehydrogenase nickel-insertion accessory protein CooC1
MKISVICILLFQAINVFADQESKLKKVLGSINDKKLNNEYELVKMHIKEEPKKSKAYLFKSETKIKSYTRKGITVEYYKSY